MSLVGRQCSSTPHLKRTVTILKPARVLDKIKIPQKMMRVSNPKLSNVHSSTYM